jgi:hypothetical protein
MNFGLVQNLKYKFHIRNNKKINKMKKIILFAVIMALATTTMFAQFSNRGILKIRDGEGRRIMLTINNKKFPQNGKVITVADLPAGVHKIKVYVFKQNNNYNNNAYGYNNNAMAQAKLIYGGKIMVKPGYVYRCTVDDYEGMDVREFCCVNNNGGYSNINDYDDMDNNWGNNWGGYNNDNNNNNYDADHDNHNNGHQGNNNGYNNGNNNGYNNGNNNGYNNGNNNGYNNGNGAYQCMNNASFENFLQTVRNSSFDSGKETMVKTQLANNWINASQLNQLVGLFSFESGKLDIAKYGATRVVDKQNLYTIYNAFTFESSKTEFANYIATIK